jgi:hypothetical protein
VRAICANPPGQVGGSADDAQRDERDGDWQDGSAAAVGGAAGRTEHEGDEDGADEQRRTEQEGSGLVDRFKSVLVGHWDSSGLEQKRFPETHAVCRSTVANHDVALG